MLLLIPQRYEFSSKSQLRFARTTSEAVVADTTKVRIFKQITTRRIILKKKLMLLLIPQRYEFSSKSQRNGGDVLLLTCCCWYHKGTNFQANHNIFIAVTCHSMVVADTTKVRIFKQITTHAPSFWSTYCCCWYHKGTNFQANHNNFPLIHNQLLVVADTTKVRIFKQITTQLRHLLDEDMLLLIPQRYEFSSKSQHIFVAQFKIKRCCWYHKGTNFQANHNSGNTKHRMDALLLIPQRYEFSSKSQRANRCYILSNSCCWYHKGTNFQANHNRIWWNWWCNIVVADTTKVRIFKQITTN